MREGSQLANRVVQMRNAIAFIGAEGDESADHSGSIVPAGAIIRERPEEKCGPETSTASARSRMLSAQSLHGNSNPSQNF